MIELAKGATKFATKADPSYTHTFTEGVVGTLVEPTAAPAPKKARKAKAAA